MRISEVQKDKIKKAFESNSKYITIRFKCADVYGEVDVALTKSQAVRIVEAYEDKKGLTIRMSNANSLQRGIRRRIFTNVSWNDFIPNWNCLASFRIWSFIRSGEYRVHKIIGKGLHLKKGSGVCRIETNGEGMYLGSASGKGFETVGNGLYLMKQGGLYDGRGLILCPNSPFKNIPIFGMIL